MNAPNPVVAHVAPGVVALVLDAATADLVADSLEFGHTAGGLAATPRPTLADDIELIRQAADQATDLLGDSVPVRLIRTPAQLRVIAGGGEPA